MTLQPLWIRTALIRRLFIIWLTLWALPAQAEEIILAADPWCPFNCQPGAEKPGVQVDILRAIMDVHDITVTYQIMPYNRAIRLAEENRIDGVFAAAPSESKILIFPQTPIGETVNVAVTHHSNAFQFNQLSDLVGQTIILARGYTYGPKFDPFVTTAPDLTITYLHGNAILPQALRLLAAKRADIYIEDESVIHYALQQRGLEKTYRIAGRVTAPFPVFTAFAPRSNARLDLALKVDQGLKALHQSGQLSRLFQRYGLAPPLP